MVLNNLYYKEKLFAVNMFMLLLLSDFYIAPFGRIFDYFSLGLMLLFTITSCHEKVMIPNMKLQAFFFLIVLLMPALIIGFIKGEYLILSAMTIGVFLVFPFFYFININNNLLLILNRLIVISITVFLVQLILFYSIGYVLDIHKMVGSIPSRINNEAVGLFRAAGLFQEPNAYCTSMFMLLTLRSKLYKFLDKIAICGLLTMLISQSLWGFGAVPLYFLIFSNGKQKLLVFGLTLILGIGLYFSLDISYLVSISPTARRVFFPEYDPSWVARYGGTQPIVYADYILGKGVTSFEFQKIGANANVFFLYSFGIINSIFFILWFWFYSGKHNILKNSLIIIFLFTSTPMFAYMVFWMWLALFMRYSMDDDGLL